MGLCDAESSFQEVSPKAQTVPQLELGIFGGKQVIGDFEGGDIASDGGAILLAEADRKLGLTSKLAACLCDERELLDETGFKTPYATWVSELDSWIAVDEEGNAELRVKYMFTDDYDRGVVGDAHVTVLGPDLEELAVVDVPTETGVLHGGEDNDGDGEADGIAVYVIPDWSDASEFWLRHDQGEYCIAQGARDDGEAGKKDPGNGQQVKRILLYSANYGSDNPPGAGGSSGLVKRAREAQDAAGCFRRRKLASPYSYQEDRAPVRADHVRVALDRANLVFFGPAHGSDLVHCCAGEGDAMETWDRGLPDLFGIPDLTGRKDSLLCTTKLVLEHYWEHYDDAYITYALLGPYDAQHDGESGIKQAYYGLPISSYANLEFAFFSACNSNKSADSMLWVLRESGGASNVLGYTKDMEYHLSNAYAACFWDAFQADALSGEFVFAKDPVSVLYSHTYCSLWAEEGLTASLLQPCSSDAVSNWWRVMAIKGQNKAYIGYFNLSGLSTTRNAPDDGGRFVRFNESLLP